MPAQKHGRKRAACTLRVAKMPGVARARLVHNHQVSDLYLSRPRATARKYDTIKKSICCGAPRAGNHLRKKDTGVHNDVAQHRKLKMVWRENFTFHSNTFRRLHRSLSYGFPAPTALSRDARILAIERNFAQVPGCFQIFLTNDPVTPGLKAALSVL